MDIFLKKRPVWDYNHVVEHDKGTAYNKTSGSSRDDKIMGKSSRRFENSFIFY